MPAPATSAAWGLPLPTPAASAAWAIPSSRRAEALARGRHYHHMRPMCQCPYSCPCGPGLHPGPEPLPTPTASAAWGEPLPTPAASAAWGLPLPTPTASAAWAIPSSRRAEALARGRHYHHMRPMCQCPILASCGPDRIGGEGQCRCQPRPHPQPGRGIFQGNYIARYKTPPYSCNKPLGYPNALRCATNSQPFQAIYAIVDINASKESVNTALCT